MRLYHSKLLPVTQESIPCHLPNTSTKIKAHGVMNNKETVIKNES
ncbi:MAG: hypothetical protein ABDH28_06990 [Brevinematia bacterium]